MFRLTDRYRRSKHTKSLTSLNMTSSLYVLYRGWPKKVVRFSTHHIFETIQDKIKRISPKLFLDFLVTKIGL